MSNRTRQGSASSDTTEVKGARAHATRRVARTGTHAVLSLFWLTLRRGALQTLYPPPPPTMAFEMKPMSTWKAMSPKMTWLGFGLGLGLGLGVRLGLGLPLTLTKPPS